MRALTACVLVLLAATLAGRVESGRACSCALPDPRAALAQADGAFVGTLVSRRQLTQQAVLVFSVEKSLKGSIGQTVEVLTAANGAACGLEAPIGTRVGLVLERRGGSWHGYLCWQFAPSELLNAALPLPAPNGRGPVALIVGGGFGKSRLAALDARGRTLAYGRGTGRVDLLAVCPGERRFAELAFTYPGHHRIVIRATQTLRIVRRQTLILPRGRFAQRLACDDRAGARVLVFSRSGLYRVGERHRRLLRAGLAHDAAFTARHAYLSAGGNGRALLRVDLRTGRTRKLATVPGPLGSIAIDDDASVLAGVHDPAARRSQIVRVNLATRSPRVTTAPLPKADESGQLTWLRTGQLLFVPRFGSGTSRVLDASLHTRTRFRWTATSAAVTESRVYGIDPTPSLLRVALPSGSVRVARQLPGRASVIVSVTG